MPVAGPAGTLRELENRLSPAPPLVGDGTWEKILDQLRAGCDEAAGQAWTVAVDATVVRAHQHAAGARHRPPADVDPARLAPAALSAPAAHQGLKPNYKDRETLGRSRGGLTSKIHLLADSGVPPAGPGDQLRAAP